MLSQVLQDGDKELRGLPKERQSIPTWGQLKDQKENINSSSLEPSEPENAEVLFKVMFASAKP